MITDSIDERAASLEASLLTLARAIADEEAAQKPRIDTVLPRHRPSAINLAHYLGLRREDIRHLQLELAAVGLSSLGRCEGHVRDILERLCAWLAGERARAMAPISGDELDWEKAASILHANTHALFGPRPSNRHVYIMVTAPDAAEVTPDWADEVLKAGADLLRINGAHGSPAEWAASARNFKARAAALGKPGRVIVDLPGPKFRIEILQLESGVVRLPRHKDRLGRTVALTQIELVAAYGAGAQIPIPPDWLPRLKSGDLLEFTDAGGRERTLVVAKTGEGAVQATCDRSLYVTSNLDLAWRRGTETIATGRVGTIPRRPRALRLGPGDAFLLRGDTGNADSPEPVLVFPESQLMAQVKSGERVILDDGKLVAVVEAVRPGGLLCRVQRALRSPTRLRSGKGIAFPDSELATGKLGAQDELALDFALELADGVGVSFVNSAADVAQVGERLARSARSDFGMILKLETRGAMQNLPTILFEALKYHPVGLMIARGDLAVELSFERLAEMQEELLWFGEACHLPVVWATEVLDTVAHSGVATRAEVTDAAMSMRAECVMLNKGPHIADATRMLADIIRKMEAHQYKKRSLYRKLAVAKSGR